MVMIASLEEGDKSASSSSGFCLIEMREDEVPERARAGSSSTSVKEDADEDGSSSRTNTGRGSARLHIRKELAEEDTRWVKRSKVLVYVMLALAAVAMGSLTYVFTKNSQESTFKSEFRSFAKAILVTTQVNAIRTIEAINALSTSITSSYTSFHEGNSSWPLVSIPDFERRCFDFRVISGAPEIILVRKVRVDQRQAWEKFSRDRSWYDEGQRVAGTNYTGVALSPTIFWPFNDTAPFAKSDYAWPMNEASPPWEPSVISTYYNLDLNSFSTSRLAIASVLASRTPVLTQAIDVGASFQGIASEPTSYIFHPVFETFQPDSPVVSLLLVGLPWVLYFWNLLPDEVPLIYVVLHEICSNSTYTYEVKGRIARYAGVGSPKSSYNNLKMANDFRPINTSGWSCSYTIEVQASEELHAKYASIDPVVYTTIVVLIFVFTAFAFAFYDFLVARRQRKVLSTAQRSTNIVSSLFPESVQARMFESADQVQENDQRGVKGQIRRFIDKGIYENRPIADLFPETTIMFADIVGFTAWSSSREPTNVFTLLETIFQRFDQIAHRHRIFKVETVGDCYVAVAGLPEPRPNHAVAMARFAKECLSNVGLLTAELEVVLGPDTAELGMRFGLHSGPTTAGVLRGERARFQLFGDTVNTASRMESTGQKNRIHISGETARLLEKAGKVSWIRAREEKVLVKGKGEAQTFWLLNASASSTDSASTPPLGLEDQVLPSMHTAGMDAGLSPGVESDAIRKRLRLEGWLVEVFVKLLKEIKSTRAMTRADVPETLRRLEKQERLMAAFKEVQEVISLKKFDLGSCKSLSTCPELDPAVVEQLRLFIGTIAQMYPDHPFHNFAHAGHVTMSAVKLFSRIIGRVDDNIQEETPPELLHEMSYGITSDPLVQFAVVLAATIHDVDHPGVPNAQLVKEEAPLALAYGKVSVAEQNSVDLAWNVLMSDAFDDLRRAIYCNEEEFYRFRALLVNAVMATDVMDSGLARQRKDRWVQAFEVSPPIDDHGGGDDDDDLIASNRRATIVIEYLIQASDVCHTMQHWHIYTKWNERLYKEMYEAFKCGRAAVDPSESWYEGELDFLDYYVIPLAKRLKDCGVFGVSSDEYMNYAMRNREEWAIRGKEIVSELTKSLSGSAC